MAKCLMKNTELLQLRCMRKAIHSLPMSDNADSLSSCCRLRNEIQDNSFSYTLGAGGVSTGSKSVLTINLNRCIQHAKKLNLPHLAYLEEVVDLVHKVQMAY